MFSHVNVGITDYPSAFAFYTAVLKPLGHTLRFEFPDNNVAAWVPADAPRPMFVIGRPFDGSTATAGSGQMTAFLAPTRAAVDACHAAAMSKGGTCEGPPGLRPHYHPDFYGAYFRDPDGNKICVCFQDPV